MPALFQKSKKSKAAETALESKGLCEASLTAVTLYYNMDLFNIYINKTKERTAAGTLTSPFGWCFKYSAEVSCSSI